MGVYIDNVEINMGIVTIALVLIFFALAFIYYWVYQLLGFDEPHGEVPYEMVRSAICIVHQFDNVQNGKLYRPIDYFVDGHFIAVNVYNNEDIIYLDEYFK